MGSHTVSGGKRRYLWAALWILRYWRDAHRCLSCQRKRETLSGHGKMSLINLALRANDFGVAFPGLAAIASDCGISPRTVSKCLAELRQHGLITQLSRGGGPEENRVPSRYLLLFNPLPPAAFYRQISHDFYEELTQGIAPVTVPDRSMNLGGTDAGSSRTHARSSRTDADLGENSRTPLQGKIREREINLPECKPARDAIRERELDESEELERSEDESSLLFLHGTAGFALHAEKPGAEVRPPHPVHAVALRNLARNGGLDGVTGDALRAEVHRRLVQDQADGRETQ